MSLVTCPCRKSLASAPVSASFPRSDLSTTKVTDETLALPRCARARRSRPRASSAFLEPGQPPPYLALELVHHPLTREPGLQRAADDRGLLGAVEALEQREQPVEVQGEGVIGHVYSGWKSCRSPTNSRSSSTRCRRTGPTSSSTCASRRTAT